MAQMDESQPSFVLRSMIRNTGSKMGDYLKESPLNEALMIAIDKSYERALT
jgi:hypothetical protein